MSRESGNGVFNREPEGVPTSVTIIQVKSSGGESRGKTQSSWFSPFFRSCGKSEMRSDFSSSIVGNFPAVKLPLLVLPPLPKSLPPKNEKPPTAETLPRYGITAEKLPPYFGFTASAEVVTAKKRKTAYRHKITAVWHYHPKSTAICDTAYKSTAMSEWSEGMALYLFVGIR